MTRLACMAALACVLGGCSIGLDAFDPEPVEVTGSIRKAEPVLETLAISDKEDLRRAQGALAIALEPQGSGAPVNWDNPDSGHKGTITPASKPFVQATEICRHFDSRLVTKDRTSLGNGLACRIGPGKWEIREARDGERAASPDKPAAGAKPSAKL